MRLRSHLSPGRCGIPRDVPATTPAVAPAQDHLSHSLPASGVTWGTNAGKTPVPRCRAPPRRDAPSLEAHGCWAMPLGVPPQTHPQALGSFSMEAGLPPGGCPEASAPRSPPPQPGGAERAAGGSLPGLCLPPSVLLSLPSGGEAPAAPAGRRRRCLARRLPARPRGTTRLIIINNLEPLGEG